MEHEKQPSEVKAISPDEIQPLVLNYGDFAPVTEEQALSAGRCTNQSGENIAVYGPKHPSDTSRFDNSLYILPSGYSTPDGWDCDGFYVPNDRVANQALSKIQGPLAIKYVGLVSFTVTKSGNEYNCPLNQGAFKPSEVCCPSNYPTCVCWAIPNLPQSSIK